MHYTPLHELNKLPHRHYIVDALVTEEGCWILPDRRTARNYTMFVIDGKRQFAHRYMWEYANGPIPDGMVVDHVCHNDAVLRGDCDGKDTCRHRPCFNPDHMRLATNVENYMAGVGGYWGRKECPKGHPRTEENTMYTTRKNNSYKYPTCRQCHNERSLRGYFDRRKRVDA